MIEVTITDDEMVRWLDDPSRGFVPSQEWAAVKARSKLADAGIPLRPSFDPKADPTPLHGNLEWWEDRFGGAKVFRWYDHGPTTSAAAPPP